MDRTEHSHFFTRLSGSVRIWSMTTPLPARKSAALTLLLAVAAGIHFAVIGEHLEVSVLFGVFFAITGAAQLILAARVASLPTIGRVAGSVLVNAALVVVWALSRTAGLPIGPEVGHPEAVFLSDAVATGVEIVAIALGVRLLTRLRAQHCTPSTSNRATLSRPRATALLAAAVAGLAFTSVAQPAEAHHHPEPVGVEIHPAEHHHGADETSQRLRFTSYMARLRGCRSMVKAPWHRCGGTRCGRSRARALLLPARATAGRSHSPPPRRLPPGR